MSETTAPTTPTHILSPLERRLLGVLIEKQKTTPDVYPMSLSAIVTGCNQKNNRDPVMNVEAADVEASLEGLQQKALVTRVQSGRVDKWRHLLYEQWGIGKVEIAVLAELLLRGPQSEGDLRGRASRMEPLENLDALRAVCQPLSQRGLVVYLTPEGRRGTTLTHGFHDPQEVERLRSHTGDGGPPGRPSELSSPSRLDRLEAEVAELRQQVAELRQALTTMRRTISGGMEATGLPG